MSQPSNAPISLRILLAYALPAFVVALPTIPVYIHLPTLYGVELGLGLAVTGLILLLSRVFDALTDPIIGVLSDRFSFKGTRRKPWIAVGALIAGVGLYKVLNPPSDVNAAYLLVWCVVLYGGWTMVAVPYLAWGAELSREYNERTRITAVRECMTLLGILGAGAVAAITPAAGSEISSVGAIAWLAIGLGVIAFPLLIFTVPDHVVTARPQTSASLKSFIRAARSLWENKLFVRLLSAWFLNGLANGIPAALFLLYLEHGLGASEDIRPQFILIYFLAAIIAIPLWTTLSRRAGKHKVWCAAMLLASCAFVFVPLIPEGSFILFGVVCILTGMALGADLALPPAIQADVLDYDQWRFGVSRAGVQFALWGMGTKFALALSVGLALPILQWSGFEPDTPDNDSIFTLVVMYAWVPVMIKVAAVSLVWQFPLTAKKHDVIRRRLKD